eukprot:scaffold16969_cov61-Phaeocystis_antarctica.AAC.2
MVVGLDFGFDSKLGLALALVARVGLERAVRLNLPFARARFRVRRVRACGAPVEPARRVRVLGLGFYASAKGRLRASATKLSSRFNNIHKCPFSRLSPVRWPVCSLTERSVGGCLHRLFLFERIAQSPPVRAHTGGKLSSVTRCRRGPLIWVRTLSSRTAHRLYSTHANARGRRGPWVNLTRTETNPHSASSSTELSDSLYSGDTTPRRLPSFFNFYLRCRQRVDFRAAGSSGGRSAG